MLISGSGTTSERIIAALRWPASQCVYRMLLAENLEISFLNNINPPEKLPLVGGPRIRLEQLLKMNAL